MHPVKFIRNGFLGLVLSVFTSTCLDPITPAPPPLPTETPAGTTAGQLGATETPQVSLIEIAIPDAAQERGADVFEGFVFPPRESKRCPAIIRAKDYIELQCFPPDVEVRLLVYEPAVTNQLPGRFFAELRVSVDDEGYMKLKFRSGNGSDFNYVVVDARTNRELYPAVHNCPKATWTGLSESMTARINATEGERVNLRESPNTSPEGVVGKFSEGTELRVIEGPVCSGDYLWWKVNVQGQVGWMAEGDGLERYLEPWTR